MWKRQVAEVRFSKARRLQWYFTKSWKDKKIYWTGAFWVFTLRVIAGIYGYFKKIENGDVSNSFRNFAKALQMKIFPRVTFSSTIERTVLLGGIIINDYNAPVLHFLNISILNCFDFCLDPTQLFSTTDDMVKFDGSFEVSYVTGADSQTINNNKKNPRDMN